MGLLLLVVLGLSGCDRLLGLSNITPLGDGGGGGGGGGDGGPSRDGSADGGPTLCSPTGAPSGTSFTTMMTEVAVTEQADFDFYNTGNGTIEYESPIGAGGGSVSVASATHPALSRDGKELLVASNGMVEDFTRTSGSTFAAHGAVAELTSTYPGTLVALPSGDTAIVVVNSATGMFQEWRRGAGTSTWSPFGSAFTPESATGSDYASLTADGLGLVYVTSSKFTKPAVRFVRRTGTDADFSAPAAPPVTLTSNMNYLASPWISDDCTHLYAVAGIDIGMNVLEKYTLQ